MRQLVELYEHILRDGVEKESRGRLADGSRPPTLSVFGYQMRFGAGHGFPLATRKRVSFHNVLTELLWFLRGDTTTDFLLEHNVHIWDQWAKDGLVGPIYGYQWRRWRVDSVLRQSQPHVDQVTTLLYEMVSNPSSRRLLVSAWNVAELPLMSLPPCHVLWQVCCRPTGVAGHYYADLQVYQRSCDSFIGLPYNIASYALLLQIICTTATELSVRERGRASVVFHPGDLVWTGGDVHIYMNHIEAVHQYIAAEEYPLPHLSLCSHANVNDYVHEDFTLSDYEHGPAILAEVAA